MELSQTTEYHQYSLDNQKISYIFALKSKTIKYGNRRKLAGKGAVLLEGAKWCGKTTTADLIGDLNTFGLIFETLCIRDLRVYAEALNGKVYHYRDKTGLECDAVVHLRNGSYGLIEIKLGGDDLINAGADTLKELAGKIDTDRMKKPSFLMVLTAVGSYAYRREDGVYVVPIGCLKD